MPAAAPPPRASSFLGEHVLGEHPPAGRTQLFQFRQLFA
jgi:hypothetical protein